MQNVAGDHVPEQKIVFTWKHYDDGRLGKSNEHRHCGIFGPQQRDELRLRHEQLPTEESRADHDRGWKSVLDRLENFVNS